MNFPPMSRIGIAAAVLLVSATCIPARAETTPAAPAPVRLVIDLKAPAKQISPEFAGLMTEGINHSYDGGLYGELIRNRIFLDNETNPAGWTLGVPSNAIASMSVSEKLPLTDKLSRSLEVVITKIGTNQAVTVSNEGFWGIPVKPATDYRVSLYAKGNGIPKKKKQKGDPDPVTFRSPLTISLASNDGSKVHASAVTPPLTEHWQKIELTLRTGKTLVPSKENRFVISAPAPGTFYLNMVSLFPPTYKNRPNGNRPDLMEKMAGLRPKFLRFPGGGFLTGVGSISSRYNWKETRGPLEFRPGHPCWGFRHSDGLGLLEFMLWCEDLGMEPMLAVFAGYFHDGCVPSGPLLEPYVQDALDEIEYLTGDAKTTHWGGMRAKDGHPEPFSLKYIEVSNEDYENDYEGRFASFHDAIKAKYPDIQLIANYGVHSRKPDIIDHHFYQSTEWYVKNFHRYDHADRNGPKILVGEWATIKWKDKDKWEPNLVPNLGQALGDSAWMCAMERNADVVIMQCYAPLFVNMNAGAWTWTTDLIGYDALSSVASVSWNAQHLFNTHRGDEVLKASVDKEDPSDPFPYSVTRDREKGLIHIKLVNISAFRRKVSVDLGKDAKIEPKADVVTLTANDLKALNTIENPEAVKPVATTLGDLSPDFDITVEPYSLTVITLKFR